MSRKAFSAVYRQKLCSRRLPDPRSGLVPMDFVHMGQIHTRLPGTGPETGPGGATDEGSPRFPRHLPCSTNWVGISAVGPEIRPASSKPGWFSKKRAALGRPFSDFCRLSGRGYWAPGGRQEAAPRTSGRDRAGRRRWREERRQADRPRPGSSPTGGYSSRIR